MFRSLPAPVRLAVAAPLAVLALAACSSGEEGGGTEPQAQTQKDAPDSSYPGKSAQQLLDGARAAAVAAKAVTIKGKTVALGKPATFTATVMDGAGSFGSLSAGDAGAKFRKIGDLSYVLATPGFYAAQGAAASSVGGKIGNRWLAADAATMNGIAAAGGDSSADIAAWYPSVESVLSTTVPAGATLERVAGKKIGNVTTTGISFTAPMPAEIATKLSVNGGQAPATLTGTVLIATEGKPYPIAIQNNAKVDLVLSDWGKKVALKAPPKKDIVSLDELMGGMGMGGF
jgi:hypothetical protein